MKRYFILFSLVALCAIGCTKDNSVRENPFKPIGEPSAPDTTNYSAKEGQEYMFDGTTVPEIHVKVSLAEWNRLLSEFDRNYYTDEYVKCDVRYRKGSETLRIDGAGIRLRGNTSRRRPEGSSGRMHVTNDTDWHHCHFQLNFHKYEKDSAHELHGARKVILKWACNDPAYVRELYCYDLFQRFGVWQASKAAHCRLYINVEGDAKETYYGVYTMIEPIDERSIKIRKEQFGDKDGFLWKCRYGATLGSVNTEMVADTEDSRKPYTLKTQLDDFETAKAQLKDCIRNITELSDEEFHDWIAEHCDVELFLRTIAVNVAVGMWDDYWNNSSNYCLYFNSHDTKNYKFWMIPYDYDHTLGTSQKIWHVVDSGRTSPFSWGDGNKQPLVKRILDCEDYKAMYKDILLELINEESGEFYYTRSVRRIKDWQNEVKSFVSNDTGEDMVVEDLPCKASWSNHQEYRIVDMGENNFFRVRADFIQNVIDVYYPESK